MNPDLRVLARFLTEFEHADFSPGGWTNMQKGEDGVYTMPHTILSPAASEFVRAAYDGGWVLKDFDWPQWKDTEEAQAFIHDLDLLARATPFQLAKLLTVMIRQDRFVEGSLLGHFKDGRIVAIVRRAASLLDGGETPSEP